MKKNLRNVLVLALGLTTTIASAQWSAESRTRINNDDANDRSATNRITVGADWGGIHVSSDVNYAIGSSETAGYAIYEAYATTDLLGFGTLTAGRKDLSYGSGALMSSNSWGNDRYTNDGIALGLNLGGFALDVGTMGGVNSQAGNYMNASGTFGGANVNVLMMNSQEADPASTDGGMIDVSAHGYDISYSVGDFTLSASMNSDYKEREMNSYGISYSGIDNLTIAVARTTYGDPTESIEGVDSTWTSTSNGDYADSTWSDVGNGDGVDSSYTYAGDGTYSYIWALNTSTGVNEIVDSTENNITATYNGDYVAETYTSTYNDDYNAETFSDVYDDNYVAAWNNGGFRMDNTAMAGGWTNGVLGYLNAGDENTTVAIDYELGDLSFGYTMHTISNEANENDREANELRVGYKLSNNSSFNISRFTDGDFEANWLTLTIGM